MNDILFGNNNGKTIRQLSKRYFRRNKVRNIAAILAIFLTAFLFTSVTSLTFNIVSSLRLSMQMQKGSKADATLGYLTEEQFEQLVDSGFVERAGFRRVLAYAGNAADHSIEINYADSVQQELTFCSPTHGAAPEKANEIAASELALKALGVEPEIGAAVPLEFEVRGRHCHFDMVLSGWWEADNGSACLAIVSEQFVKENADLFKNTYAKDGEMPGMTYSEVVLKDKTNVQEQLEDFIYSVGGNPEDRSADNYILCTANQSAADLVDSATILFVVVFILMFVACGYLLIYNIFDISVMQDVRQYGLLRTIGTSPRQIKSLVNRQAVRLTLIGLPAGLAAGFFAGWMMLPAGMDTFGYSVSAAQVSASPLVFVTAALFTILTVVIGTRRPAKKAAKASPLEAVRYTGRNDYKKRAVRRTGGVKLSRMAFASLGRNKRRSVFIIISMLLCIVLFNSVIVVTQSMDEKKWIARDTKTDFTVYSSAAANIEKGFQYREDALPQPVVDMLCEQPGVEDGRCLYRNTVDDRNVLVDYGFEGLDWTEVYEFDDGSVSKGYHGYGIKAPSDAEDLFYGNVIGASGNFWEDLSIFDGEKDTGVLRQKMDTGAYIIVGCEMDALTGEPQSTPFTDLLQVGDSISFYKDGKLVRTYTILARANVSSNEMETTATNTGSVRIAGDAPFVYLSDTAFKQIYDTPTLLSYGFNVEKSMQPQMEKFLSRYVENNPTVAYSAIQLRKERMASMGSMILTVGGLIGFIFALAGLINFINMMITSIITRRHEFAVIQSIGMTNRQLRRMMVCEGVYYAAGADILGVGAAAIVAVTVLKSVLNSSSMWFFTLRVTLVPALVIGALYLLLAAFIPVIVLHFFHKGTVVERLRTSE